MKKEVMIEKIKKIKYEICFSVSDLGFLVKKIEYIDMIGYDGNPTKLETDQYNVLTNENELLFDNWYDNITFEIKNNYCIYGVNEKYGVFDRYGNILIKPLYDNLYYDSEDIFMAKNNNKFGFVRSNGHQMTPIIFSDVGFFYDDFAAVKYNYKWGFINKYNDINNPNDDLEYSIYPQYDAVDDFENGYCEVVKNNKKLLIDKNNNIITQKVKHL